MTTPSLRLFTVIALTLACFLSGLSHSSLQAAAKGELDLRERLKDEHAVGADFWFYNDLEKARAEARRLNKPLFVTFRCVPCHACKAFDAEVAKGSKTITSLATREFIPVRLVEMKGVDLTQFEFDFDLNWAAMFIHPDGTVYGRYGTQSAEGPDAYNSIESLQKAMMRVLDLHRQHDKVASSLAGKRPRPKGYKTALEMPGLDQKEKLRGRTERNNCIHCHNIHDAINRHAQDTGTFKKDILWRYPLPDNLGMHIDPKDGRVIDKVTGGTAASRAGLMKGDTIIAVDGQPIISIADIQWVLHHLPNSDSSVTLQIERAGRSMNKMVAMEAGWKRSDISWRGSLWSISPRLRVWSPDLKPNERKKHGIQGDQKAMLVKWINRGKPGGRAAREAGLREGDVIVGLQGKPLTLTGPKLQEYIKLNFKIGDTLVYDVLRSGRKIKVGVPLVE